jgi:hypothetical protein
MTFELIKYLLIKVNCLPCHLVKNSKYENPGYCLLCLAHGAPDPGRVGVANVDVALHGQSQGQPG